MDGLHQGNADGFLCMNKAKVLGICQILDIVIFFI